MQHGRSDGMGAGQDGAGQGEAGRGWTGCRAGWAAGLGGVQGWVGPSPRVF